MTRWWWELPDEATEETDPSGDVGRHGGSMWKTRSSTAQADEMNGEGRGRLIDALFAEF
jgi:hypothetical protein